MCAKYRGARCGVVRFQFNGVLGLVNERVLWVGDFASEREGCFCAPSGVVARLLWPNGSAEYPTFLETLGRVLETSIVLPGF